MKRRFLIAGLCASLLAPSAVWAQGFADQIVRQLRAQGYNGIQVSNTWLGRTRIVGNSGDGSREIIIDPRTGEILRDLYTGRNNGPRIVDDRGRDDRSGSDDRDNDDDRDEDDDDDDEDNSGHGSGGGDNSGSGSGDPDND